MITSTGYHEFYKQEDSDLNESTEGGTTITGNSQWQLMDSSFDAKEVSEAIKKLKSNKAVCPDGVPGGSLEMFYFDNVRDTSCNTH